MDQGQADQAAIRALQIAYGALFDARDAEAFAALYTEDAVLVQIGGKEIRTREKFAKAVSHMPLAGTGFHRMLDAKVEVDGDVAHGVCGFAARSSAGADVTGHYKDGYRRTAEGWRFAHRAVFLDPKVEGGH
ncbi:MAG: putative polyketide cyclase [Bradyrhizobium sp.]|nr:putative polyketide cyclase [Bradyrhizobium sp.]